VAKARVTYLSEGEKAFIHAKTMQVLAEVGVAYNTPLAVDLLAAAGAEVDRERLTARFGWGLVERCLATVPKEVLLAGRDPSWDRVLGRDPLVVTSDGMATHVLDDLTGEKREGTLADLARFTRLVDALDEIDVHWPSPHPSDVEPDMAPLAMQATCLRNTGKHIQDEIREPELVEPVLAMYEAAGGATLQERPVFSVTNCTIAPLQHDRAMTEASLKLTKRGVPIFILPMPQAGTTGPMTLLGTCIVHLAELLSAVVLFQLSAPGCPVIAGVGSAVADMRSGGYLSASPEIGIINMICLQMSRFYGLLTQATGVSADSSTADFQAGSEGGMTGLCAALVGADSLIAAGGLEAVQTTSLAKMVLDADQVGALRRYIRESSIDEDAAVMDDIRAVGIGGHYLGRRSTRAHARTEVWRPALFARGGDGGAPSPPAQGGAGEAPSPPLIERAVTYADELLATHEVAPLSDDAEREIEAILAAHAARRA